MQSNANPPQARQLSRRSFLRGAAATLVLVAGGGVYRAADQGVFSAASGPAYRAWDTWRSDTQRGPLELVRAGILAANPHNTQPWLFRVSATQIELYADTARQLGAMDPYLREMHIGLGCALENMLLAAQAEGYAVQLDLPAGTLTGPAASATPSPVATLTLAPRQPQSTPLYEVIAKRHTDRYAYAQDRTLDAATEQALLALGTSADMRVFVFRRDTPAFQLLVDATVKATEQIIADATMSHDSHAWFNRSWQELQRDKDGPYIDTAGVPTYLRALGKLFPPSERTLDSGWLDGTRANVPTSAALGLIAVRGRYDRAQALQAGQLWQRMHLWATTQALAMQPINQLPEMVDRERQLGQAPATEQLLTTLTAAADWQPTFAFRLGYPTAQPLPSARRPVEDVLLS